MVLDDVPRCLRSPIRREANEETRSRRRPPKEACQWSVDSPAGQYVTNSEAVAQAHTEMADAPLRLSV
jgi:hypothetical protein